MRLHRSITVLFLAAPLVACFGFFAADAQVLPHGLKVEKILDNAAELGNIVQAPTGELWLLERSGRIRVYVAGEAEASLDVPVTTACQGGLLDAAFPSTYANSGKAFIYYVDGSNRARVDTVLRTGSTLQLGSQILDLGPAGDACRPGGDLIVGRDNKLYVATGDLSVPSAAQDDGSSLGKILRVNLDGSVPADNPSGTLVWAKGLRNPHGLAYNPDTARAGGTFYATDVGQSTSPSANDETNQVRPGGNYGWANGSGSMGGSYTDPLHTWPTSSLVNPLAVTALHHSHLGSAHQGALAIAAPTNDAGNKGKINEIALTGAELDQFGALRTLFDPNNDSDGTPDAGCPTKVNVVEMGGDGELYAANNGDNSGIWRIWHDTPGPREVSATGSPFPLTVEREGTQLKLGWENLGALDAKRPTRFATGQRPETYRVWEGTLPIVNATDYDHVAVLSTNGTPLGPARLESPLAPGSGNRYYLLSAQGDNLEGGVGTASTGTTRPVSGTTDYCDTIGRAVGNNVGKCLKDFQKPTGGVLKLVDYNPVSPTFRKELSLEDFRGRVIRVDISALNCFWCDKQAYCFAGPERRLGARDAAIVTIMMNTYNYWDAIPSAAECESQIAAWQATHGDLGPILCDVDLDGNGRADAAASISPGTCGTPENMYVDQGFVQYKYVCGAEEYYYPPFQCTGVIRNSLAPEVNPESCE